MASTRSIYHQQHGMADEVESQANRTELEIWLSKDVSGKQNPRQHYEFPFRYVLRRKTKFVKQDLRYPFINAEFSNNRAQKTPTWRAEIKKGPDAHQWSFIIIQTPGIKGISTAQLQRMSSLPYMQYANGRGVRSGSTPEAVYSYANLAHHHHAGLPPAAQNPHSFPCRRAADGLRPEARADRTLFVEYMEAARNQVDQSHRHLTQSRLDIRDTRAVTDGAITYLHDMYGEDNSPEEIQHRLAQLSQDGLPADNQPGAEWAHYVQGFGAKAIKRLSMGYGGKELTATPMTGDFIYCADQVFRPRNNLLRDMIGVFPNEAAMIRYSAADRTWLIPTWLFCNSMQLGNCLFTSGMDDAVFYDLTLNDLTSLVRRSHPDVQVVRSADYQRLGADNVKVFLECTNIYLERSERDYIRRWNFDQLIRQVETKYVREDKRDRFCIPIRTACPVSEIIVAVIRNCAIQANNHFNYSGVMGRDPVLSISLRNGDNVVVPETEGDVLRRKNSYVWHCTRPLSHFYPIVFCNDPEEETLNGSQKLPNGQLEIALQPGLSRSSGGVTVITHIISTGVIQYGPDESGNRTVVLAKPTPPPPALEVAE